MLRLRNMVWQWNLQANGDVGDETAFASWKERFESLINDNLNMPGSLALTWELAHSDLPPATKLELLSYFDNVLGLSLNSVVDEYAISSEIEAEISHRSEHRSVRDFARSDSIREKLSDSGFVVQDGSFATFVRPKTEWEMRQERWHTYSSEVEVASLLDRSDEVDLSLAIVACNYLSDVQRCVNSAFKWLGERDAEIVVVDNGSSDGTDDWLESVSAEDDRLRVIHTDHPLGEGAAKRILLKQCLGRTVVMLDTSVEVTGDIFGPIEETLKDETVGVTGPFGLRTTDLHHFHDGEGESGDMDAMQAYCFAFRRELIRKVGLPRQTFRFYRNLDLDYSFQFKAQGFRIVADPKLPVGQHEHRVWSELAEGERDELSRKNYGRFLERWGDRADLLTCNQN